MDKYDPMTGELLNNDTEEKKITGYDPMTGEPIFEETNVNSEEIKIQEPVMNFDPMTGEPMVQKKKNKKWLMILGGVAVIAILVFTIFKSGLFLSKADKVLVAMANTMGEQSHFVKELQGIRILSDDSYSVKVEADAEDTAVDVQYATKASEKQLSGSIKNGDMPEVEFLAGLTSSEVKVQIPDMSDNVFIYNYKNEKDGYITDLLREDEIEAIDSLCESLYSQKEQKDMGKSIVGIISKEYHSLKFEKVKNEEFEIDGKARKCKGYMTTVTEDNFVNIVDEIEDLVEKKYADALYRIDVEDIFDDVREEFEDMPDIEVIFYIYKNKIACISLEAEDEEIQILFKSSKGGMHQIEVTSDYGTEFELKSSVKGSKETYQFIAYGSKIVSLKYDYKSGDFSLEMRRYGTIGVEGNLQSNSKEMKIVIDEVEFNGEDQKISCDVSVKKGASMQKFDGEEFDLGDASESDYRDLQRDISSYLY